MTDLLPGNNAKKTRGRPFRIGNPGRPVGSRNRATLAAERLLAGESEALTRKVIEIALAGDTTALRLCLERILPPAKSRPIKIALPPIETGADVLKAQAAAIRAMSCGGITPDEAATIAGVLEARRKAIETADLERRLIAVEESVGVKQR